MQAISQRAKVDSVARADPPVALNKPSAFAIFPPPPFHFRRIILARLKVGYDQWEEGVPAGGHYFSTPSTERVRDLLSPEAESFPERGVCWGLDLRGGSFVMCCMWMKISIL
jgi:hypothetical protein